MAEERQQQRPDDQRVGHVGGVLGEGRGVPERPGWIIGRHVIGEAPDVPLVDTDPDPAVAPPLRRDRIDDVGHVREGPVKRPGAVEVRLGGVEGVRIDIAGGVRRGRSRPR